jgi:hydroxymethylbilane synthase
MTRARPVLNFGTLAGSLAKAQTQSVIERLQQAQPRTTCQMTIVPSPVPAEATAGEPFLAAAAAEVEFLEERLLAGEFRLVVIRAADLVLPLRAGVVIAAVPPRDTPFDAFLNREGLICDDVPAGSRIGVLNLRAKVQIQALWPSLEVELLSGGLDAALQVLMRRRDIEGLILPAAATEHLGIQGIVSEIFYPEMMLPSGGQGLLAILAREDDREARDLLASIHSEASQREMEAEHAFLQRFASDQDLPVCVLARVERDHIEIAGAVCSLSSPECNRTTRRGRAERAGELGVELAESILFSGQALIDLLEADFPDGLPADEDLEADDREVAVPLDDLVDEDDVLPLELNLPLEDQDEDWREDL